MTGTATNRSRRVALWSALTATVVLGVVAGAKRQPPSSPPPTAAATWPDRLLAVPPSGLPEAVAARYRLKPDARFLGAIDAISRFQGSDRSEAATVRYVDGSWLVVAGETEIGKLVEFPSFEEETSLLVRLAQRTRSDSKFSAGAASGSAANANSEGARATIDPRRQIAGISKGSVTASELATELVWLALQVADSFEQADPLMSEAWAAFALRRAEDPTWEPQVEALLASALGYELAALRASSRLAADDPVRSYCSRDAIQLGVYCSAHADRPAHFLRLELLSRSATDEKFASALAASPFATEDENLAIAALRDRVAKFEDGTEPGLRLAGLVREALETPVEQMKRRALPSDLPPVHSQTREFEAALRRFLGEFPASSASADAIGSFYRAVFYSGLEQAAGFLSRTYASGPATAAFAREMGSAAPGTADEMQRWIAATARLLDGERDIRAIVAESGSFRSLGGYVPTLLASEIARHTGAQDPLVRSPIAAMFERLDTRPSHLGRAARLAIDNLVNSTLHEKLGAAASSAAPYSNSNLAISMARRRRDAARLKEIGADPAMPTSARITALEAFAKLGSSERSYVLESFRERAEDPEWGIQHLIELLEADGDLTGALDVIVAWLKRGSEEDPLTRAYFQSEQSRILLLLGRKDEAARAVAPAVATYKEDALYQAAVVELARHRPQQGLDLALRCLERYPQRAHATAALIARARWQLGDDATAAREIATSPTGLSELKRSTLVEAFVTEFAKAPEARLRAAYTELVRAKLVPYTLAEIALAIGQERGPELALVLLPSAAGPESEWKNWLLLRTYDLLAARSGTDVALDWLRLRLRVRDHNFALELFQERRFGLVLDLYPNGERGDAPRIVRALKAAAHLHVGELSGPRWEGLVAEAKADAGDDPFVRFARFLLGLSDAAPVLDNARDLSGVGNAGWLLGVKRASTGDFAGAERWYQVALEAAQASEQPYAWALNTEWKWRKEDRSTFFPGKPGEF